MGVTPRAKNTSLIWVVAGTVGLGVLILSLTVGGGGGDWKPVEKIVVPCRIEPVWEAEGAAHAGPAPSEDPGPQELLIYLDTSHSMGGYLPPPEVEAEPGFRTVAQLVPGHLVGAYSGRLGWRLIDRDLRTVAGAPAFERPLFTGAETRLDLAVADLVAALETGRGEAAVLITDLVSTSGPEGAMGAAEALLGWLDSAGIRSGRFDLGLLGARAPYWGVESSTCTVPGPLGCWYSEHANRYLPLTQMVRRPLYFVFFGASASARGGAAAGGATASGSRVEQVGLSFQKTLEEEGFETRWALLTLASRHRSGELRCTAGKPETEGSRPIPQFALLSDGAGRFQCHRDELVRLSCCVVARGGSSCEDAPMRLRAAAASWPGAAATVQDGRLVATVDCEAVRDRKVGGTLRFEDVLAEGHAAGGESESDPWREWNSRTDEVEGALSGTLQMDRFLDTVRLRPDGYRIRPAGPVLSFER